MLERLYYKIKYNGRFQVSFLKSSISDMSRTPRLVKEAYLENKSRYQETVETKSM